MSKALHRIYKGKKTDYNRVSAPKKFVIEKRQKYITKWQEFMLE